MTGGEGDRYERVWVVASGSYSDYRVLCACDSKKRAEAVAKAMSNDEDGFRSDARVESLPLVTSDPEKVSILSATANVWDDGTTSEMREWVEEEWPFDQWQPLHPVSWRWVRAPWHKDKGGRLDVRGTDHERVRRVFSDRTAQLLAEDAFRLTREKTGRA